MNYHKIILNDTANGDGIRVTLFVSGCSLHCSDCHNPQCWSQHSGQPFTDDTIGEIMKELSKSYNSGITLSGGHPLEPYNIEDITSLCKKIKKRFPTKTIWLYTGLLYEDVKEYDVMNYVDVLVDGKYEKDLRDLTLKWRGSSNQRVIDVKKTRECNQIVLHCN